MKRREVRTAVSSLGWTFLSASEGTLIRDVQPPELGEDESLNSSLHYIQEF